MTTRDQIKARIATLHQPASIVQPENYTYAEVKALLALHPAASPFWDSPRGQGALERKHCLEEQGMEFAA